MTRLTRIPRVFLVYYSFRLVQYTLILLNLNKLHNDTESTRLQSPSHEQLSTTKNTKLAHLQTMLTLINTLIKLIVSTIQAVKHKHTHTQQEP